MDNLNPSNVSPLVRRALNSFIAVVLSPHSPLKLNTRVTVGQFLGHVSAVAELLPEKKFALNLCDNRYLFMVSFCAVILRRQTNLLPPNKKIATQHWLIDKYVDVYTLNDSYLDDSINFASFIEPMQERESQYLKYINLNIVDIDFSKTEEKSVIPNVPLNHLAAISFTSGSTGESKPNEKSWQTIVESSRINASNMLYGHNELLYQLATVPPQHMWGLETSVLLPLFTSICVADLKPLFPQDIYNALNVLPAPRMLISSPIHLRSLAKSKVAESLGESLTVNLILCATSPLSKDLAVSIEAAFSAELREVYGCSEIGSMAVRQTSKDKFWRLFKGVCFFREEGHRITASAHYLPNQIELSDNIKMISDEHFVLLGRSSDAVDIAGKRGSLQEINSVLLKFPELIDGLIFMPKNNFTVRRLAAFVVLPEHLDVQVLKEYLKKHLDNAFIPRPIIAVDSLPRQESGKLSIVDVESFYRAVKKVKK